MVGDLFQRELGCHGKVVASKVVVACVVTCLLPVVVVGVSRSYFEHMGSHLHQVVPRCPSTSLPKEATEISVRFGVWLFMQVHFGLVRQKF